MHSNELKALHVSELLKMAEALEIENAGRMRKQELMFAILKKRAKAGEQIFGDGVLEVLPDGFGFLRSPDTSYLASTDDIYISPVADPPLQPAHRRHDRRRDPHARRTASATSRWSRSTRSTASRPRRRKNKILFENLTPLFPNEPLKLERDIKAEENITGRIIDIIAPIGKGQRGLLVSSPKTGKTVMLQHIAHAITANHPDVLPDRAADRRAAGGSDRDAAHGARRGRRLDLRRAGRAPRAGRRDGDRERQAPGRAEEGRGDPARLDHPPGPRLQHRACRRRARC